MPNGPNPEVCVFWDDSARPTTTAAAPGDVFNAIWTMARVLGDRVQDIRFYMDAGATPAHLQAAASSMRAELQSCGALIIDAVCEGRAGAASKIMLADCMLHALDGGPQSGADTMVIITADPDLSYAISKLRLRGHEVYLVCPPDAHSNLQRLAAANPDDNLERPNCEDISLMLELPPSSNAGSSESSNEPPIVRLAKLHAMRGRTTRSPPPDPNPSAWPRFSPTGPTWGTFGGQEESPAARAPASITLAGSSPSRAPTERDTPSQLAFPQSPELLPRGVSIQPGAPAAQPGAEHPPPAAALPAHYEILVQLLRRRIAETGVNRHDRKALRDPLLAAMPTVFEDAKLMRPGLAHNSQNLKSAYWNYVGTAVQLGVVRLINKSTEMQLTETYLDR